MRGGEAHANPVLGQSQGQTQGVLDPSLTVLSASATGDSATLSIADGSVSRRGESLRIHRNGVEAELPNVITVDGVLYNVDYEVLNANTFTLSTSAAEQTANKSDGSLHDNWDGSWDQCVSGAAVKGGLTSGIVTALLSGPAAAVTAAAAGMIGSGVVAMLAECWGKPFNQP